MSFFISFAAQDRREMLKEVMRRGTSSLGTDTPSEREINRLTARSDEEFWLFEKMDEERRQKERYKSRLMGDHEVPDWAYTKPDNPKDMRGKGFDYETANLSGKRRRKDVVYADTLSDWQFMKAVEHGEQPGKSRRDSSNNVDDDVFELRSVSGGSGSTLKRSRSPKTEQVGVDDGSSAGGDLPTWKTHKKRSIIRFV